MGIRDRLLMDTPIAVLDVECTGLTPGLDRIVEVCVFRIEPGTSSALRALDTLVNPNRQSFHRTVHGITPKDTDAAPRFADIAKRLYEAVSGAVLVAHNAGFDLRFLQAEFEYAGFKYDPPYMCTMALPVALGVSSRGQSLEELCRSMGIVLGDSHVARQDARAAAVATLFMRNMLIQRGCRSFADIARTSAGGWLKFFDSFERPLPDPKDRRQLSTSVHPLVPRMLGDSGVAVLESELATLERRTEELEIRQEDYSSALLEAVSDYQLSKRQFDRLRSIQAESGLIPAQIRAVHAQVFAYALAEYAKDDFLDERERHRLTLLFECLTHLGWAPGQ